MSIVWQDPPSETLPQYHDFFQELIANPGRWALFPLATQEAAHRLRHKRISGQRGWEWEVTTRRTKGELSVYVRCTGEGNN